jgi:hypothetical protein
MTILTKIIVDCTDGTEQVVPLTADEIAQLEADRVAAEAARAEQEAADQAKAAAKASAEAKLAGLGLTVEEVAALLK